MENSNLQELLDRNNVSINRFLAESYHSLLVSIFEVIVESIENNDVCKIEIKNRLRNSSNKALTIKNLVKELTNCDLNNAESKDILKYLEAYFNKTSTRFNYGNDVKNSKLTAQEYKCVLCSRKIKINNSELDHKIPWVLVGDELGTDNLQMLCTNCNRKKSKNAAYNLKMFLISKD